MVKAKECNCCQEVHGCITSLNDEEVVREVGSAPGCITEHPGFRPLCLQPWSLKLAADRYKTKFNRRYRQTKISTIQKLKIVLEERFPEMNSELFKAIKIYDPKYWIDEADFGVRELNTLRGRFLVPLSEAGINERDLFVEWKRFRSFARRHFEDLFKEPKMSWQRLFNFRRLEFPNLSLPQLQDCSKQA